MEQPIKRTQDFWDTYFMDVAARTALLSKDPDRKVGAVLVTADRRQMSFGYNGFPAKVEDYPSLLADKALKLKHMVHAEENCLTQAPFYPLGCSLYVTRFPCEPCAKLIVRSRVTRLIAPDFDSEHPRWGESWTRAYNSLHMAGVDIIFKEPTNYDQ